MEICKYSISRLALPLHLSNLSLPLSLSVEDHLSNAFFFCYRTGDQIDENRFPQRIEIDYVRFDEMR